MTVEQINVALRADTSNLTADFRRAQQATDNFGAVLQQTLQASAARATASLNGLGGAANGAGRQIDAFKQHVEGLNASLGKFGGAAVDFGKKASLHLTAPLLLLGKTAIDIESQFELAMNQLAASTGATGGQIEALSRAAKSLGADLSLPGTSAKTAAESMLALAKGGLTVRDVLSAAKPAMQLSAAGLVSNSDAAEVLVRTLDQFGLAATDSARVADLLAAAGNRTTGGFNGVAEALKQAGTVLHTVGVPINEAVTAIALLGRSGISASVAGSTLKQAFALLADPSKKARAVLQEQGIALFDNAGKMKSLSDVAEILHEKLGKLTQQQRLQVEHTLGGARAMQAFAILAKNGAAGVGDMAGKIGKVGAAADLAGASMKGLPGAIAAMKTAFSSAAQAAIEPISADLTALGKRVGELITAFANLPSPVRRGLVEIAAGVALLGPVVYWVGQLSLGLKALLPVFSAVRTGAAAMWAMLGGPATLALAALAAAVALFAKAWEADWFKIREIFAATWETILGIFATVQAEVGTAWTAFTDLLQGNWVSAWANMKQVVVDTVGFIAKLLTNPVGTVQELIQRWGMNFAEQMAQAGPGTAAPAGKGPAVDLGPNRRNFEFAGNGTFDKGLAALGRKARKEAEPTSPINDNLNAFIADNLARIALLKKKTGDDAIEIMRQFAPIHDRRIQEAIDSDRTRKALEKEAQTRKDFVETLVKQARESYIYQSNDATGRLRFTQDQRQAMLDTGKTFDKLTEAELKEAHAYLQRQRILNTNKSIDAFQTEQKQKLVSATWESWKALDATNKAWEAFASGNKYATEVLQKFGVVLKDLPKKDQGLIIADIINGDKKTAAMAAYQDFASGVTGIFDTMFNNIHNGFKSAFQSVVGGFEDLLRSMAAKYLASQLAHLFLGALGSAFGGKAVFADILGGLEGKASGGLVSQDTPYLVGERGPELFMPNRPGRIVPNGELAGAAAAPININFTVHATDAQSFKRSQHQIVADLNRASREASRRSGR